METIVPREFIDLLPSWLLFLGTALILSLAAEVGYRLGRAGPKGGGDPDKKSHAGVILGALLGLLGLLLAFSFGIVDSRFQARKQLLLEEANALSTAYLRADMLPAPEGQEIQQLLREYVAIRLGRKTPQALRKAIIQSEELHEQLWGLAVQAANKRPQSETVALFVTALNEVIDLHEDRVTVGLVYRLPYPILITLYFVATLSVGLIGFNGGLSRARPVGATATVIIAVSVVLILIIDIDSPWQGTFNISQQALEDTQETMTNAGNRPLPTRPR